MSFPIWPTLHDKKKDKVEMKTTRPSQLFTNLKKKIPSKNNLTTKKTMGSTSSSNHGNDNNLSINFLRKTQGNKKFKQNSQYSRKLSIKMKNYSVPNHELPEKSKLSLGLKQKKKSEDELFCLICNIKFSSIEFFVDHQEKSGFICRVCTAEFNNHDELESHFFKHSVSKCKACKEEFICRKDLLLHRQKMHRFGMFECKICNKTFTRNSGLERHRLLNHSDGEDSYKCVVCGNYYKFSFQLKHHLEMTHIPYEHIECGLCHNIYFGPERLKSHIKSIHLNSEEMAPTSCPICGKIFSREHHLSKHLETHDDTVSLCEICGMSIKGKTAMKNHMNREHPRTGTFICKICNEQFSMKKLLRWHYRRTHYKKSIPLPVYCEICGKVYKSSAILKKHKLIHSSERPFKCEICGASFKQSVTLSLHSRVHSSVGKYCCNRCGMTFKWKQTFDKHLSKCENIVGH